MKIAVTCERVTRYEVLVDVDEGHPLDMQDDAVSLAGIMIVNVERGLPNNNVQISRSSLRFLEQGA